MQKLNEIIDFYLQTETNYALMITGEWGVGKTYYYKNILNQQIAKTNTFHDSQKKYRPILVSLFGLKSVEEVQTEIFLALFPQLKNKSIKLGVAIGKSLIKGILSLKNLGEYFDFVYENEIEKKDWINFTDLVICFDDLERASNNFRIEELIGYINSLVENENVKIIIIANENKIALPEYKLLKEKVVGNSIEFIPDLDKTFDSLIQTKFKGYKTTYLTFLQQNKEFILDVFKRKTTNLRILSFALTYFQTVYSEILLGLPKHDALKDKQEEILLQLLKFSLIVSIEYKEGKISYSKREDLDLHQGLDLINFSLHNLLRDSNQNNEKIDIEKTYRDKLIEQFYTGETYQYFESIYEFFTGGSILRHEDLVKELKSSYHVEEGKILPQYEIFNSLKNPFHNSLSDREYRVLVKKMLKYSDQGGFEIGSYMSVFIFGIRFGNPLKFNPENLEKRIIKGMKRSIKYNKYTHSLSSYLGIDPDTDFKENLVRIRLAAIEINDQIGFIYQKADLTRLFEKCYTNFDSFYNEIFDKQNSYSLTPIFEDVSSYKFYLLFLNSDNYTKLQILNLFKNRYSEYPPARLKSDTKFLEDFKVRIENKMSKVSTSQISRYLYQDLLKVLESATSKLIRLQ